MTKKTLAFEIGTEEIPAFDLHDAIDQVQKLAETSFAKNNIEYDSVIVRTTPRRIIMLAKDVADETSAKHEEFRGPACRIAFDADGNPTKAAAGFARGKGVAVEDLIRREDNGAEYVFACVDTPAVPTIDLLPDILLGVINGIQWPKSQRWGNTNEQFSRPVRWLFAMLDGDVIPIQYAGLTSSNLTYGHRFLAPGPFEVPEAKELLKTIKGAFVTPNEECRERDIREQVAAIEEKTGLVAELPAKTMAEVVNLCEYPTAMVGTFDELFLEVPKEITVDAMLVHQRYFPLFNADGSLANKFIITSNGDPAFAENIIDGNQRVVAARLYDAKFFYDEDRKQPLEAYVDRLDEVVFQEALGTMRAKANRMVALAGKLADMAGFDEANTQDAKRAALLAKADLVTSAVVEFTSVQGIMGSYYAAASGETAQVAQAIADHYRPRFAGDELPASSVGRIVATADKIDTICGLFAVGQAPTGSSDPFALRRAAIGIIAMLEAGLGISLSQAVDDALAIYEEGGLEFDRDATYAQVIDFFITRTKVMLRDGGCSPDTVDAVLATGIEEPATIIARARALEQARTENPDTFEDLATAYARANNLRDAACGTDVNESLLCDVEIDLLNAIAKAEKAISDDLASDAYASALDELAALRKPIDTFFDSLMVMDEDLSIRANRMKLLNRFVAVFAHVADFGKMAKTA
ncbi:MAG: glycine--tRNA ligase subunit beta [Eggerthellaceae bacterium]|nr:glycine--tRNA ligase subunit beta [Eggerthellaceae bacterium]